MEGCSKGIEERSAKVEDHLAHQLLERAQRVLDQLMTWQLIPVLRCVLIPLFRVQGGCPLTSMLSFMILRRF